MESALKKARKQYTITKKRESWSPSEHALFVRALAKHGRDWRTIEGIVKTKNIVQIRSHAQKHFIKALKSGAHIPPPRPKKKKKPASASPDINININDNSNVKGTRANFSRIYHIFAEIVDPTTAKNTITAGLSALDKEIIKLLIRNLEKSLADADARNHLLATYEIMQARDSSAAKGEIAGKHQATNVIK